MNVTTIILSGAASILAATLILTWRNSDTRAEEENTAMMKQIHTLNSKLTQLEAQLERSKSNLSSTGQPTASLTQQLEQKKIQDQIDQANAERNRLNDRLAAAQADNSPSILEQVQNEKVATRDSSTSINEGNQFEERNGFETGSEETISDKQFRERRRSIQEAKVYATVGHIKDSAEGKVYLAKLLPSFTIKVGAKLAVRRQRTGIAGRIQILKMIDSGGDTILVIEPVSAPGGRDELELVVGDELILEPEWTY